MVGNNLFAYCENNPINKVDHSGRKADFFDWLGDTVAGWFGIDLGLQEAANRRDSDMYQYSTAFFFGIQSNAYYLDKTYYLIVK